MATLRFNFGTMGSGKSTVALQIHHNLANRQLYGLLLTTLDREGIGAASVAHFIPPPTRTTPFGEASQGRPPPGGRAWSGALRA